MKTQSDLRAEHSVNELEPVIRKAFDEQTPFKSIYKYEEVIQNGKIKNLHDYVYGVDFYFMDGDKECKVDIKLVKSVNDKGKYTNFSVEKAILHRDLQPKQLTLDYLIFCHGDICYMCAFEDIQKQTANCVYNFEDRKKNPKAYIDKGKYYLIPLAYIRDCIKYTFKTPKKLYMLD
jgi:hypothetical protein